MRADAAVLAAGGADSGRCGALGASRTSADVVRGGASEAAARGTTTVVPDSGIKAGGASCDAVAACGLGTDAFFSATALEVTTGSIETARDALLSIRLSANNCPCACTAELAAERMSVAIAADALDFALSGAALNVVRPGADPDALAAIGTLSAGVARKTCWEALMVAELASFASNADVATADSNETTADDCGAEFFVPVVVVPDVGCTSGDAAVGACCGIAVAIEVAMSGEIVMLNWGRAFCEVVSIVPG